MEYLLTGFILAINFFFKQLSLGVIIINSLF